MSRTRLVSTPPQFRLSRLSRPLYLSALAKAHARGFRFVRFQEFLPDAAPLPPRFIAMRHDVDFAPAHALDMAELEREADVVSTYFFLVDGGFYNPLDRETVRQVRRIHALGHEIGLHYALGAGIYDDVGEEVAFRMRVLADVVGGAVRSFCQHDPVKTGPVDVTLPPGHPPCVDVRHVIRDHDLLYVSESAMMWRHHTFESALDEDRNLCLLAHPHSWLHPEDDYIALIRDLEAQETRRLGARYDAFVDALPDYYTRRLREGV